MSAQFAQPTFSDEEQLLREQALKNRRFGLLLWRVANGGVFAFFIFANLLMRTVQTSWPPEGVARLDVALPLIISVVLLFSAIPASRALSAIRKGDNTTLQRNLLITMALGLIFIVGIIVASLRVPYSGSYSSVVLSMNGFHAVHAIVGVVLLAIIFRRAQKGTYTKDNNWAVEAIVVFWHFVDLMWVFFFLVLYIF